MYEAVQPTASTGETWVIVVVVVVALIFMISAPLVADLVQHRANDRNRRRALRGGPWVPSARSQFPGEFPRQRPEDEAIAAASARRTASGRHRRPGVDPAAEKPTRPDLPAQAAAVPHEMPRQRTGETDRAARSRAAPDAPGEDGRR